MPRQSKLSIQKNCGRNSIASSHHEHETTSSCIALIYFVRMIIIETQNYAKVEHFVAFVALEFNSTRGTVKWGCTDSTVGKGVRDEATNLNSLN